MISTLLLPLLLAAAPVAGGGPAAARAAGDDPAVQIWLNSDRTYLPGERAKVQVRARNDGYLLVLHVDPDGVLRVLFPLDPNDDSFVRGGKKYEIRGRGGRESFEADSRSGRGTVYAAVSGTPFRFGQFVLGDHWDYRALAPDRLPADPEQDLNELVRRMADASFDYDILSYTVVERVVYATDYSYSRPYYGYDSWGCGGWSYYCGSGLSVGVFFGRPYRRYYYDPFYDPFFYDPYYYRPVYLRPWGYHYFGYPVYGYPYHGYPYYGGRYYGHRDRNWARPYTPYRFRDVQGVQAGYRPRGFDLRRSVNTVYLPPVVRDRTQDAVPARRLTDTRPSAEARPVEPRRVDARPVEPRSTAPERRTTPTRATPSRDGDPGRRTGAAEAPRGTRGDATPRRAESRTVQPNIEARRAREPDQPRVTVPARPDRQEMPREVRPLSRSEDVGGRPSVERQPEPRRADPRPQPSVDARPSRGDGGYSRPEPRAEPRAEPRSAPRPEPQARPAPSRAPDRGSFSPPSRSDGGSRGGWSGGGGTSGGRRR